jgi:hypothetical protein
MLTAEVQHGMCSAVPVFDVIQKRQQYVRTCFTLESTQYKIPLHGIKRIELEQRTIRSDPRTSKKTSIRSIRSRTLLAQQPPQSLARSLLLT